MSQVTSTGTGGSGGGGTLIWHYTYVDSSPYVVLLSDAYMGVESSVGPITIQLPDTATTGRVYIIKDRSGDAFNNNITVTTVSGLVTIDGLTSQIMNIDWQSMQVIFNGAAWEIF